MLDDKKLTAKEIKQEVEQTAKQAIQALKRIAKIIKGTVVAIKNPVTWIIAGIIILVIALIGMTQVPGKNEVGHICVYTDENGKQQKVDLNQPDNANSNDKDADKKGPTAKDSKGKCDRIGWGKKTGTTGRSTEDSTATGGGEFGTIHAWDDNKSDFGKPDIQSSNYAVEGYSFGQCTWYVHGRRKEIGKPMPHSYFGNGGDWWKTAQGLGMDVDHTPKAGDAVSFPPKVGGADATYGHVSFVEKVLDNGDFVVSESNVQGLGVVSMRTIPASTAQYAYFIH